MKLSTFNKMLAAELGMLLGVVGIIGIFVEGHLFKFINVDANVDIFRLAMAAILLAAVAVNRIHWVDAALFIVGGAHLIIGLFALGDRTVGDFAVSGYTGFDVAFYIIVGATGALLAIRSFFVNNETQDRNALTHSPSHS